MLLERKVARAERDRDIALASVTPLIKTYYVILCIVLYYIHIKAFIAKDTSWMGYVNLNAASNALTENVQTWCTRWRPRLNGIVRTWRLPLESLLCLWETPNC